MSNTKHKTNNTPLVKLGQGEYQTNIEPEDVEPVNLLAAVNVAMMTIVLAAITLTILILTGAIK